MNKIYFLKVNPHANKEILKCAINLLNLKEPKGQNSKAFANFYSSCLARLVALLFGAEFTSKKATQLKLSKTENGGSKAPCEGTKSAQGLATQNEPENC